MGLLSNLFSEFKIKNGVLVKYTGKDANVEIPNSVTIIGEKAFTECKTLVSVTIPNSVKSIENNAFSFCTSLKEITLPNSVTSIGDWAFFYCTGLVKIVIPSSVESIGNAICGSCSSLKQIIVYENNAKFKSIDGSLYTKNGNTLVQYAIGSNVKAFTIPSSVTSIRDWAFWGCNNLISITIPSSVTGIGLSAFHGCRNLKTIYNLSKLNIKKGAETHGAVAKFADNVYTELPKNQSTVATTKSNTTQTTNPDFDIQNGVLVKYNGKGGKVVIPSSVTTIGKRAFANFTAITSVTIPSTVKKIEVEAFDTCVGLKEVYIPASVETISGAPFIRCTNLTAIKVDANNKRFKAIEGSLYEKLDDGGIRLVQYAVGKKDTIFNLPSEVTSIQSQYVFWGDTSLKSINANDKDGFFITKEGNLYTDFGKKLLQYACGKTNAEFIVPEGVEEIGGSGCSYCKHLKKVKLPSTLKSIGHNSFQRCDNLQEVVIPAMVTEIKRYAFWGCKNLKTVYNLSKLDIKKGSEKYGEVAKYAENVYTVLPKTQSSVVATKPIPTPKTNQTTQSSISDFDIQNGVLVKYKGKGGNVVIPNSVTTIGKDSFYNCSTITNVAIPNTVKKIEDNAFDKCTGIKEITIPSSVEEIVGTPFVRCSNLTTINVSASNKKYKSIDGNLYEKLDGGGIKLVQYAVGKKETTFTIPSEVKSLNFYAFWGNTSLKNIIANDKDGYFVTKDGNLYSNYGKRLFQYACGKTDAEFTISEGVEEISDSGCSYCTHLKKVNLPSTLITIGYNSFQCCENLQEIVIPASVTEIEKNAFWGCKNLKTVYNLSKLDIQKGADTHGYVAKCADNVYTALPKTQSTVVTTKSNTTQTTNPDFDIQNGVLISYKGKKEKVVIPEGVTSIGESAFEGNLAIKNVIMPTSLGSIGNRAFWGCKGMETFTIPSSVNQIGDNAFWATSLKEIFIPKTLAKIGVGPFAKCESLTTINVDTDNPNYKSIDGNLYTKNGETLVQYAIGKQEQTFVIPEHVTMLQAYAFRGHKKLREITLPKNLTKIGKNAFKECINLYIVHNHSPHIDVRSNVYANGYVGKYAKENQIFNYAQIVSKPISDFEIKDGVLVKYVGNKTTVIVPTDVTKIGDFAFVNNYEITEVLIPGGVTSIGEASFNDCTNLKKVTFPITLKEIGHNAFMGCEVLDNVILPDSVEKIGVMAFGSCYNLTNVLLPTELVEIPDYLFLECTSLIGVTIPETVERIGEGAFASCTNLTSITIPASVKEICDKAFRGCANLKTVYNDSNLKIVKGANTYGYVAKNADTIIEKVKAKPVITNAPVLEDIPVQKQITAPDFEIENGVIIAYKGNSQEIIIPDGIVEIGANVFRKNNKIISISIPDSVKAIGPYAFNNCTSLERIDLGDGLRYIGDYAFSLCKKVEEITLPHSLTLIGEGAFQRCNTMSEVYNRSAINVIEGSNENGYVASNADIVYKENQYLKNIVIEGNVIVEYKDEREYERIALPANATAIGIEAFAGNTTIKELHTPDSLVEIGYRAFENCSKLTKVVLGSELERIAMHAFTKCTSLEDIVLPKTLKSIASWSFDDCTSLKEIVIPANVTAIEDGTFYGCTSLEKVTFLGEIQSIGAYAFDGCASLKEIVIPQTCNVDETAFYNTTCKVYNK
ncbi:MAG: leucine-rich repeat domain-containing protein [Clostridia bacterium]|nr:leucine-rich repeat domain-containing protein [Clostridia bacterium]